MFYKNYLNHHKKLLHFVKLKSIQEKSLLKFGNKKYV